MARAPLTPGTHQLPVFLVVRDGKRLHLELHGETVAAPLQRLLLTPNYQDFTFEPAPIGERHPPVQVCGCGYGVWVCGVGWVWV